MNNTKKKSVGFFITVLVAVLALVSVILYIANVNGVGYFKSIGDSSIVVMSVLAIIFALGAAILGQLKDGDSAVIVKAVSDLLRIAVAVLLIACMLRFIAIRAEGLGYIFGADESLWSEVRTPANMSSAYTAIAGCVLYGVSWLVSLIGAFCGMVKKSK